MTGSIRASVSIDLFTAHLLFTYEPSIVIELTDHGFEVLLVVDDHRCVRDHGDIGDGPSRNHAVLLGHLVEGVPHEKGVQVANKRVCQHESAAHIRINNQCLMIVAKNVLVSEGGLAAKEHDPVEAGRHDVKNGENFHLVDEAILRVDHRRLS